ncbi:DNA repair protein RecO [soil metagenome]
MIVRTDAVVLRAFDYGETSRIATLYTRTHGRVSVLARGARRPKSRFGSTLQPMAYIQAVFFRRDGRGLQTLKEAAHVRLWHRTQADLERLTGALRMIELTRALTEEEEASPLTFRLLVDHMEALENAPETETVLPHFQLRFARILGFSPDVRREDVESIEGEGGQLSLENGRVLPIGTGAAGPRAGRGALRAFAILARTDLATALRLRLTPAERNETQTLADAYMRHHVEEAYPDRVRRVTDQLAAGRGGN